jgi:amino acid transporter
MAQQTTAQQPATLQRGSAGFTRVLFISIATVAPAGGAATSVVIATAYAGGATPLAVLLATVGCAMAAICIGQLSRKLPSAGGLYTYAARSLGPSVGFLTAWGLVFSYILAPSLYYGYFGLLVVNEIKIYAPSAPDTLWIPIALLVGGAVWYLNYRGLRASSGASVILGTVENLILVALAISLIVVAAGHNTVSVFSPHTGNTAGTGGVVAAAIYSVLAIIGFEAAAPIGEEAKSPRRTIGRAVVGAALLVGLIYTFVYYAADVYFGPSRFARFSTFGNGSPFPAVAREVWGPLGILVLLALLNSTFGCNTAITTSVSRMVYALGRTQIVPEKVASLHGRYRTPHMAVAAVTAIGVVAALASGIFSGSPIDTLAIYGTTIAILFVIIYLILAVGCATYYWNNFRNEFNPIVHVVVPICAIVFFVPVAIASLGINFAGLGIAPITGVAVYGLVIAGAWVVLGVIYLLVLRRPPNRWKLAGLGTILMEEDRKEPDDKQASGR